MAAESGGLDVRGLRYPAVILGCALAALGGSALVLSTSGGFVPGMTAGRGFIAMGVVVLAKWRPQWIFFHAIGFGMTQGLQFLAAQLIALQGVPKQLWVALPYLVTVMAVVFAPGSRYPAAVGIPYRRAGKAA
jgi:simple sugar transport system permease protein